MPLYNYKVLIDSLSTLQNTHSQIRRMRDAIVQLDCQEHDKFSEIEEYCFASNSCNAFMSYFDALGYIRSYIEIVDDEFIIGIDELKNAINLFFDAELEYSQYERESPQLTVNYDILNEGLSVLKDIQKEISFIKVIIVEVELPEEILSNPEYKNGNRIYIPVTDIDFAYSISEIRSTINEMEYRLAYAISYLQEAINLLPDALNEYKTFISAFENDGSSIKTAPGV
jgi:hypothetical protein